MDTNGEHIAPSARRPILRQFGFGAMLALSLCLLFVDGAFAQESPDQGVDRAIADGGLVYEANCQACHQADGTGLEGVFPPLVGNSNLDDADYVRSVITGGRTGELDVNGVVYNGAMPSFGALSDDQIDALVVFVQQGLGQPGPVDVEPAAPTGTPAATELPIGTVWTSQLAFLVALIAAGAILLPVLLARPDDGQFTSAQVWMKSFAIVLYFAIATVFIPSMVVEANFLASPPSIYDDLISADVWGLVRDLIGATVWLVALAVGVWALRRAQRDHVI